MSTHGTYAQIDGRPAIRFERRIAHPIEHVWRAVTEPSELAHWFPADMTRGELRLGAALSFAFADQTLPDSDGEVVALDAPRLLEFTWNEERLRFELEPIPEGTLLRFTHFVAERDQAARDAAGWHVCLTQLEARLSGGDAAAPTGEPTPDWRELYEAYVEQGLPSGAPIPG